MDTARSKAVSYPAKRIFMLVAIAVALVAVPLAFAPHAFAKSLAAPSKPSVSRLSSEQPGQVSVKLSKARNAKGYQLLLSTTKKFASANRYDLEGAMSSKSSFSLGGLKAGKTYYVKARAFNKSGSTRKWGKWSAVKTVSVKAEPDLSGEINDAKADAVKAQGELAASKAAEKQALSDLANTQAALSRSEADNDSLRANNARLSTELEASKAEIARLSSELEAAKAGTSETPFPNPTPAPAPSPSPAPSGNTAALAAEIARLQAELADAQARLAGQTATITYVLDGGKLPEGAKTSITASDGAYTLPEPTKKGSDFAGWYTSETGGQQVTTVSQAGGNATVYARWSAIELFYAYVDAGKTSPDNDCKVYDDTLGTYVDLPLYELYIGRGQDAPEIGADYRDGVVKAVSGSPNPELTAGSLTLLSDAELSRLNLPDMSQCTTIDLTKADTSSMTDMGLLLSGLMHVKELDLSTWDMSHITQSDELLENCEKLESVNLTGWDLSAYEGQLTLFSNCPSLKTIDATGWKLPRYCNHLFEDDFRETRNALIEIRGTSSWDTSKVEDASNMFSGCTSLASIDCSSWDLRRLRNASNMFYGCKSLGSVSFGDGTLANVEDTSRMFAGCSSLASVDLSRTGMSNVTSAQGMFGPGHFDDIIDEFPMGYCCTSLSTVRLPPMPNLSDISMMFRCCSALTDVNIKNWNISKIEKMEMAFDGCSSLASIDVTGWDVSSVTDMLGVFQDCANMESVDLSEWDTSNVTRLSYLLYGCTGLENLKTGTSWNYGKLGSDPLLEFPVSMKDENGTVFQAHNTIPEGAHTYVKAD